ncbi:hypothetical protein J2046_001363 [Rhizobium petrolearium]|uniref:DUF5343 domain-containing protein n=1 Tax=Neorhizobium petrolearium TaxID=515361 RepID=UPI001AE465E6|nr:DUF5343 domain-containing protein [Neorhizobium petrolearium]MBP1843109.1 hypothetical protein [Neorhizobium petrolearium]
MPASLPYMSAPGTIKTALDRIKSAATPERVTQDFVQTKLQIKGGTGASVPPFLKKIGLVNSDGSPSILYHKFRNSQTAGQAIAEALKFGYRELFDVNEYCYELSEKELHSLVCQVTGAASDSSVARQTVSSFRNLRSYADFDAPSKAAEVVNDSESFITPSYPPPPPSERGLGLNLSYTINLNLPATADQAVFNAIFRSLREHLLNGE